MEGYKALRAGQAVEATVHGPLSVEQDGYRFSAGAVWAVGLKDC
jgi:hypothetical protein